MSKSFAVLIVVVAFVASVLLTALVRSYLLRRRILDIPNRRSSHCVPTPRGGGVSVVIVFLFVVLLLVQRGALLSGSAWALIGGGLAVAGAGWLDDQFRMSPWVRLLIHFVAAGWALWQLGGIEALRLGWFIWDWGWVGQLTALVGLVWMINLYNFMDGIDGIAGMEAICASGLAGLFLVASGLGGLGVCALTLAAASGGFLVWNWPPAKIFMGDVGSGFLGFVFGVLAISSANEQSRLLWPWLILLSVFIVDSTITLLRRLFSGLRWYEAHCSHAYQHAARRWSSHSKVTLAVAGINMIWLPPLGWAACIRPHAGPLLALVALLPLVWVTLRYDAGQDTQGAEVASAKAKVPALRRVVAAQRHK